MPEEVASQTQQQPAINPEIAKSMEIALNGGIIPKESGEKIVDNAQAAVDNAAATTVVTDVFQPFKEKFGYNTAEDAMREIEELRAFKATPKEEQKFENEESKTLFTALQKGDRKSVYQILEKQERLDSVLSKEVTKDTAAEIIKLGMQLKFQDLTQQEIEYKYNKQFFIPKEPVQSATETDEDFAEKQSQWQSQVSDVEMMKIIEAKLAKPDLEAAKTKIVLPQIDSEDEGYSQYKKMLEESPKNTEETVKAYKAFTTKVLETKVPFNDEANKIAFEFQYEPDGESFNKAIEMVSDQNLFYKSFLNQDGTPDRKKFLEAIYFGMNKDKIILEAMKQAKNATLKSQLPDNSGGVVRQLAQQGQELSELDKQMKLAGII